MMGVRYSIPTCLMDEMIPTAVGMSTDQTSPLYGLNIWLAAALAAEPNTNVMTERGPVTRWLGYTFGQPRITKAEAAEILPIEPGDPNPFFQVVDAVSREGGTITMGESPLDLSHAEPVTRAMWLTIGYLQAVVMAGGDATGMQLFFKVSDISQPIPGSLPRFAGMTWADLNVDNRGPWTLIDGYYYRGTEMEPDGDPLSGVEVFALISAGVVVITPAQYRAISFVAP